MARTIGVVSAVLLGVIVACFVFFTVMHYYKVYEARQTEYQAEQTKASDIKQLLALVPQLRIGMTEDQVDHTLRGQYGHYGFFSGLDMYGADRLYVTELQRNPEKFLVLEFLRAPATGKRQIYVFQRAKISVTPY